MTTTRTHGRSRPPRTALRAIAIVLAAAWIPLATAQDTGLGVDLQLGTRLEPAGGAQPLRGCDQRGMSWLRADSRRSPTGFRYRCAPAQPELEPFDRWLYTATLGLGLTGGGDADNAQWQRFNGWDDTLLVGPIDMSLVRPSDGRYIDFRGARLNADNQYFKVTNGRAGRYRFEAFFREQPNVVSANARSLWSGIGTEHLTLPEGFAPAATSPAIVASTLATAPEHRLQVQRDKLGIGYTYFFDPRWTGFLNAAFEERKGARPFGGAFFFNFPFADNGGIYEIPRVIDDGTTTLNGGARFVGGPWRMEFAYMGSFYRNRHDSYDYEVPFAVSPVVPGAVAPLRTLGSFAYEPDNDYHNLRVNFTRKVALRGELSLTATAGRLEQDDRLLAPFDCQGQFGIDMSPSGASVNPFLFPCANWNTTAALSRTSADLAIDTSMFTARLVLQPSSVVTLRGDLRFDRQDYRGDYLAFNPLTGQYGYVAENGAQGSVVPGEIGFWDPVTGADIVTRIRNLPLDKDTFEASLGADWRFGRYNTVGATYTFTRTEREHREVDDVEDDSVRLTWTNRRLARVTWRANLTVLDRAGNPYEYDPYEFTFSTSLPGFVVPDGGVGAHTVEELRKYDVATRDQRKIDVMAAVAANDTMTVSASVRAERNDYDAVLGRQGYDTLGTTLQWEWQRSLDTSASVYFGYDRSELDMANVNDGAITPDPALGGATYALAARWWVDDVQRNRYFGATLDRRLPRIRFDLVANFVDSRGTTGFEYAGAAALAWQTVVAFPVMTHRVATLTANVHIPITPRLTLRVFELFERGRLADWHYLNFDTTRALDHRVYTDGGPESYRENMVGVLFQMKL